MTVRPRFVLIGLALGIVVYFGLSAWHNHRRAGLIGLTDRPCTAEGRPVTGSDFDDWAALCFYRARNARLLAAGIRPGVVMIGDSITMGWPDQGPEDRDGATVNRGVGKQSSSQILLRFMQDAVSLKPQFIHIIAGTNDVAGTTGPVTPEQFRDNLLAMAEIARAHDIPVILGTIPPATGFGRGDPREAIARANARIEAIARAEPGVTLADYHAVLSKPDGAARLDLLLDDVHPNAAGYAAMQPVFEQAMKAAMVAHPPAPDTLLSRPVRASQPVSGMPPSSR